MLSKILKLIKPTNSYIDMKHQRRKFMICDKTLPGKYIHLNQFLNYDKITYQNSIYFTNIFNSKKNAPI